MYDEKDFQEVVNVIRQKLAGRVKEIILFGSYAKGTAREDSDMDIAILTDFIINRPEKLKILSELRWDIARKGYNTDFLLKAEEEFKASMDLPTLSKVIHNEGKLLWKKN